MSGRGVSARRTVCKMSPGLQHKPRKSTQPLLTEQWTHNIHHTFTITINQGPKSANIFISHNQQQQKKGLQIQIQLQQQKSSHDSTQMYQFTPRQSLLHFALYPLGPFPTDFFFLVLSTPQIKWHNSIPATNYDQSIIYIIVNMATLSQSF